MGLGDLGQRTTSSTVMEDRKTVHRDRSTADAPAFELRSRMPARTRSTIRLPSGSAMAPMITIMEVLHRTGDAIERSDEDLSTIRPEIWPKLIA